MKIVLLFLVALTLFSGCALVSTIRHGGFPTYTTEQGLRVYDETTHITPSAYEVNQVAEYVVSRLGGRDRISGAAVMLVSKWIEVPQMNGTAIIADGFTNIFTKDIIASVFQTCFADSGMVHELAHLIHDQVIPDWGHDDKVWWDMVKTMENLIIEDLCPDGYEHKHIAPDYVPPKKG